MTMGFDDRGGKKKLMTKELHENHEYKAKMAEYSPETTHTEAVEDHHRVVGDSSKCDYGHHKTKELANYHASSHNKDLSK